MTCRLFGRLQVLYAISICQAKLLLFYVEALPLLYALELMRVYVVVFVQIIDASQCMLGLKRHRPSWNSPCQEAHQIPHESPSYTALLGTAV